MFCLEVTDQQLDRMWSTVGGYAASSELVGHPAVDQAAQSLIHDAWLQDIQ